MREGMRVERVLVVVAQLTSVAAQAIMLKLVASVLPIDEFGRFALALAIGGVVNLLLAGPLLGSASRLYADARDEQRLGDYVHAVMLVSAAILAIVVIIALLVVILPSGLLPAGSSQTLIISALTLGTAAALVDLITVMSNAALRHRRAATLLIAGGLARLVGAAGAATVGLRSAESVALFIALTLGVTGLISVATTGVLTMNDYPRGSNLDTRKYVRSFIVYMVPFILWAPPAYIITFGDRWLLAQTSNVATVGLYAAMSAATSSVAGFASSAVSRVVEPTAFALAGDARNLRQRERAHQVVDVGTLALAAILLPLVVVYAAWPDSVIAAFTSARYTAQSGSLSFLMLAATLFAASQLQITHGLVAKRPSAYLLPKWVHAAILLTLLHTLTPTLGVAGVAIALVIANLGMLLFVETINRRQMGWGLTLRPNARSKTIADSPELDHGNLQPMSSVAFRAKGGQLPMSILMSTYIAESPANLAISLQSLADQTRLPAQIVLVLDGPVGSDQELIIHHARDRSPAVDMTILRLPKRVGLAGALNTGLEACRFELVARMDSDDICLPQRLALQHAEMEAYPEVDVLAAWHEEFDDRTGRPLGVKTVPANHEAIATALRWRNVISNPTVVYRRSVIRQVGGYRPIGLLEDYDLYMRLLAAGRRIRAIQRVLVRVRSGSEQRGRRGGRSYVASEWRFRYECWRRGNFGFHSFLLISLAYTVFRLMPNRLRTASYRLVRVRQH